MDEARELIKALEIDNSYYGDRSKLKFEKKICLVSGLNTESSVTSTINTTPNFALSPSLSYLSRREKIKVYITK